MQRKLFNHKLVPPIELTTENIDNKRHYVLPDGDKLKSVTTVLSEKSDKTALFEWKKRVGEEQAQKITTQASIRGTAFHNIAERYVLNEEDYKKKEMPVNIDSFNQIKPMLDKYVDNVYGTELALYSKVLGAAGRTDLVAEYDGVPSIIDYKTSRKIKKEKWIQNYFLQSTIYSMMFEYHYKIKIPQIVILMAVDHENPQIFVKQRKHYVNEVIKTFVG